MSVKSTSVHVVVVGRRAKKHEPWVFAIPQLLLRDTKQC